MLPDERDDEPQEPLPVDTFFESFTHLLVLHSHIILYVLQQS